MNTKRKFNGRGRMEKDLLPGMRADRLNIGSLSPGMYFYKVFVGPTLHFAGKLLIIK